MPSRRGRRLFADGFRWRQSAAILVVTRGDGSALSPDDLTPRSRAWSGRPDPLADGEAVLVLYHERRLDGFALSDAVGRFAADVRERLPNSLTANVTGGPGVRCRHQRLSGASFILWSPGGVVAILLILTYRSGAVAGSTAGDRLHADRVAAVPRADIAKGDRHGGGRVDGPDHQRPELFGAGTNYALLVISPLPRNCATQPSHRDALAVAVRQAGPAIIASNATVVLHPLTLLLASSPSTSLRGPGGIGIGGGRRLRLCCFAATAAGLARRLFWRFVLAKPGTTEKHRNLDGFRRPTDCPPMGGRPPQASCCWVLAATIHTGRLVADPTSSGLFRLRDGYQTLSQHFPSGQTDPLLVIARHRRADAVAQAIRRRQACLRSSLMGTVGPAAPPAWQVITDAPPVSQRWSFDTVAALGIRCAGRPRWGLVGGFGRANPGREDSRRPRPGGADPGHPCGRLPAVLWHVLLRAALAPLILVGATVLSAMAALGLGRRLGERAPAGLSALDITTPCSPSVLVALGWTTRSSWSLAPGGGTRTRHPPTGDRPGRIGNGCGDHQCGRRSGSRVLRLGRAATDRFLTQLGIIVGPGSCWIRSWFAPSSSRHCSR